MSRVCVHGLGYIGLPTAAVLATHGHEVYGYDTDAALLNRLKRGDLRVESDELRSMVQRALRSGDLTPTDEVARADYHLVCVPTPLDERTKRADVSAVVAATQAIAEQVTPGDTVVVESTVPPRTTVGTVRPLLEESGLAVGEDFHLVYSPETVLPGNIVEELHQNDRIVGGMTDGGTRSAVELYESFVEGSIYRTNATTAEFAKLAQNTFRDTNIALANELAKIAHDYDVDSREAIRLANTHPRVNVHHPGPGVGGHCVPVDPWFLGENSEQADLIEHARTINDGMVDYVLDLVRSELVDLSGRRIAVFGVAYKGNVADTRQSPTIRLAAALVDEPTRVRFHDPHVEEAPMDLEPIDEVVDEADVLVIMTDHDEYRFLDPERLHSLMATPLIVDTKAMLDPDEWTAAGFDVVRI